jgi:starch phosphorylase
MEFLLGRSLANNVTNLLLDPIVEHAVKEKGIDWLEMIEQEPDAGWATEGWGAWQRASSTPWPPCSYRLLVRFCVTSTGMFRQSFVNGWQQENPDNWLREGDPWEICRQHEKWRLS